MTASVLIQPEDVLVEIDTAVFGQLKAVGHLNRFRRANLGAEVAEDANFKVDVVCVDVQFFVLAAGAGERDTRRRADARALVAHDALFRVELVDAPVALAEVRHLVRIHQGDLLVCQLSKRDFQPFKEPKHRNFTPFPI